MHVLVFFSSFLSTYFCAFFALQRKKIFRENLYFFRFDLTEIFVILRKVR